MPSALGFAWRFLLVYGVVVALWMLALERPYDDGLAWAAGHALSRVERPRLTTTICRRGAVLVVKHVSRFQHLAPQEIVMRRVHSNVPLFVALVSATRPARAVTRLTWLAGGGLLLAASHLAHVLAYVHHHYALHNIGPYYTAVTIDETRALGVAERFRRPATLRRDVSLATADVFNIVLQRAVPILLWLPLFLGARWPGAVDRARAPGRVVGRWGLGLGAALAALLAAGLLLAQRHLRAPARADVEGLHLGMSGLAAGDILSARGYEWIPVPWVAGRSAYADVWPRRGPLAEERYEPRFNWIGLRLLQPPRAAQWGGNAICVVGIETAPSDSRPERVRIEARTPSETCAELWRPHE